MYLRRLDVGARDLSAIFSTNKAVVATLCVPRVYEYAYMCMYQVSERRKWRDDRRTSQHEAKVLVKRVGLNRGLTKKPLGCMS
jgi:hypothetical protein